MHITTLRQYLEFAAPHAALERHVLEHGKPYNPQPLTEAERALVERCAELHGGFDSFQPRECYYNAQMLVRYDATKQLRYVEGFGTKAPLPLLHGWASINGKVIDLTWRNGCAPILGDGFTWEYWGVEIPTSYVRRIHLKERKGKALLDDMENGFPLLRKSA